MWYFLLHKCTTYIYIYIYEGIIIYIYNKNKRAPPRRAAAAAVTAAGGGRPPLQSLPFGPKGSRWEGSDVFVRGQWIVTEREREKKTYKRYARARARRHRRVVCRRLVTLYRTKSYLVKYNAVPPQHPTNRTVYGGGYKTTKYASGPTKVTLQPPFSGSGLDGRTAGRPADFNCVIFFVNRFFFSLTLCSFYNIIIIYNKNVSLLSPCV